MTEAGAARAREGTILLLDHLEKISESAKVFIAAVKGFRRDLPLSTKACPKYFHADFPESANIIGVPPMIDGMSFAGLREMLSLAESAIDGSIRIKNPPAGPDTADKECLLEEMALTHSNLMDISDTAYGLYQTLQTACFEFDVFNTKNIEVEEPEANIVFERDSLNVSRALSRALSERAIRLDIDLMQKRREVETGNPKDIRI